MNGQRSFVRCTPCPGYLSCAILGCFDTDGYYARQAVERAEAADRQARRDEHAEWDKDFPPKPSQ